MHRPWPSAQAAARFGWSIFETTGTAAATVVKERSSFPHGQPRKAQRSDLAPATTRSRRHGERDLPGGTGHVRASRDAATVRARERLQGGTSARALAPQVARVPGGEARRGLKKTSSAPC